MMFKFFFYPILIFFSLIVSLNANTTAINWLHTEEVLYSSEGRLSPSDGQRNDWFGNALHYFDSTLVISSLNTTDRKYAGELYIFNDSNQNGKFSSSGFQKILAFDDTESAYFGNAITHSGDTLLIAAKSASSLINKYAGAVYQIIDTDKDRDFAEESMIKITSSAFAPSHGKYGTDIAADENTLVIGAPGDGYVYIIEDIELDGDFNNNIQQKIRPVDYISSSRFGYSVASSNETIVIGAPGYSSSPTNYSGAIHILKDTNNDGIYNDESLQTINAPASEYNDQFGISVAISNNTIVIGADEFRNPAKGATYVITDTDLDGNYAEEQLVRLNIPPGAYTGRHINFSDSTIYVSTYRGFYIIRDTDGDGDYLEEPINRISTTSDSNSANGTTAISGNQLVVSNPLEDAKDDDSGTVNIYEKIAKLNDVEIFENITEVSLLNAKSNDDELIKYSIAEGYDEELFSINEESGELSFILPPNFENSLTKSTDGNYRVKIKASTKSSYSFATQQITVLDVNESPFLNTPIEGQEVDEDSPYSFIVPEDTFLDEDNNDILSYSTTLSDGNELPTWLNFDTDNLKLSGIPENNDVDTITIKVLATDIAKNETSTNFELTVKNTNDIPYLNRPLENQEINEDSRLEHIIPQDTFIDVDIGDTLTYKANLSDGSELPSWLQFDVSNMSLIGTPENNNVGGIDIEITATDSSQEFISSEFTLTILNTNDVPIAMNDQASTNDSTNIEIQALANDSDEDGDTITLVEVTAEQGSVQIVNSSTDISYTPKKGYTGNDIINYSITDNNGGTAQAKVTVNISATPVTPNTNESSSNGGSGGGSSSMIFLYLLFQIFLLRFYLNQH